MRHAWRHKLQRFRLEWPFCLFLFCDCVHKDDPGDEVVKKPAEVELGKGMSGSAPFANFLTRGGELLNYAHAVR